MGGDAAAFLGGGKRGNGIAQLLQEVLFTGGPKFPEATTGQDSVQGGKGLSTPATSAPATIAGNSSREAPSRPTVTGAKGA